MVVPYVAAPTETVVELELCSAGSDPVEGPIEITTSASTGGFNTVAPEQVAGPLEPGDCIDVVLTLTPNTPATVIVTATGADGVTDSVSVQAVDI